MFKLRGCPKCQGDLFLGEDIYGRYLNCVQCGRYYAEAEAIDRTEGQEVASAAGPPEVAALELAA